MIPDRNQTIHQNLSFNWQPIHAVIKAMLCLIITNQKVAAANPHNQTMRHMFFLKLLLWIKIFLRCIYFYVIHVS